MPDQLPPPQEIADSYNEKVRNLQGEYTHQRWGETEIKRRHYRQTELSLGNALGAIDSIGRIAEVGCGPAVWTTLYLARASRVDLVDISEEMLERGQIRIAGWEDGKYASRVGYHLGDFLQVPLEAAAYDTFLSVRAFEYFTDKPGFARRAHALLRPGGRLAVVTKNGHWHDLANDKRKWAGIPRDRIPFDVAMQLDCVGWSEAESVFRDAGFLDIAMRPVIVGAYHIPWNWRSGLAVADLIHGRTHRRQMRTLPGWIDRLTESYVLTGRKA